jgi:hypothetical protein
VIASRRRDRTLASVRERRLGIATPVSVLAASWGRGAEVLRRPPVYSEANPAGSVSGRHDPIATTSNPDQPHWGNRAPMDLHRQGRVVRAWLWLLISSRLLFIVAGRTHRTAAGHRREALARSGSRVLGASASGLPADERG